MTPETIIADVLPVGGKLSTDANSHVRTSFAGAVTLLAPQIGKTTCANTSLTPSSGA